MYIYIYIHKTTGGARTFLGIRVVIPQAATTTTTTTTATITNTNTHTFEIIDFSVVVLLT